MSFDCLVIRYGTPNTVLSAPYVVKSGDTLVKIAKAHGVADWREIYNHPDNRAFKAKRPNPDRIFPGDVLSIPGRRSEIPPPRLPQSGGGITGGSFGLGRVPLALNLRGGKSSDLDLDYKHPGNPRIRVTLFWVTNCVNIETSPSPLIAKTAEIFGRHGLSLDLHPGPQRTERHTIQFPDRLIEPDEYNSIRLEAHRRFDDQQAGDRRQRLPVFFCEFRDVANGLTIKGDWLPYNFVSGASTADKATMAHEIVHAAGLEGHIRSTSKNLMSEPTHERSELFKFQVEAVAKGYFAR